MGALQGALLEQQVLLTAESPFQPTMIIFVWNVWNRQIHKHIRVAYGWESGKMWTDANMYWVSSEGDETIQKLIVGMIAHLCEHTKTELHNFNA